MTMTAVLCCRTHESLVGYDLLVQQIAQDWPQLLKQGEFRNLNIFGEDEPDRMSFHYQEPATGHASLITVAIERKPLEETEELLQRSPLWPPDMPFDHEHAMHIVIMVDDITDLDAPNTNEITTDGNTPTIAALLSQILVSIGGLYRSAFAVVWVGSGQLIPLEVFTDMGRKVLPYPMTEAWVFLYVDSDEETAFGYTEGMANFNIPEIEVVHPSPDVDEAMATLHQATTVLLYANGVNYSVAQTAGGVTVQTPTCRYDFNYSPTIFDDSQMVLRLTEINPLQ